MTDAPHKLVDGVVVALTAQEIADREAEEVAEAAAHAARLPDLVRAEAARRLRALALPYTPEERETWAQQVREAEALVADPEASAPFLQRRAAARGIAAAELAVTVLNLASSYADQAGIITGAYDKLVVMDPIPTDFRADSYWTGE